jgi:predicted AlkP superfamily phosphohydrolase/phosphomutase
MSARALFVGVDAGDAGLIAGWARAGVLPHLRDLLGRGTSVTTENPVGLFVGAVWPSFYTATSPARHARYCYNQIEPGSYALPRFRPTDVKREPFWNALGRAGRRVAIVDVPKTFPSQDLNGVQLVDWGTHDPDHGYASWPPGLAAEVAGRFGQPEHRCDGSGRGVAELAALRDRLLERAERRAELAAHLLGSEPWDLFGVVFSESHCVGHQFWHVHDPDHPCHDRALAAALGDPLRDVYAAIDRMLGRILCEVGSETRVYVLASHGMGPHYDATFLLKEILRRLREGGHSALRRRTGELLSWGWAHTPTAIRQRLSPLRERTRDRLGRAFPSAEVEGSLPYFDVPNNDVYGAIRINLAGREPAGTVRPGAELDALCGDLDRELRQLVNLETGRPLVRRVLRTAEHYAGEHLDALPDLLVEWDRGAPVRRIHSPRIGTIEGEFPGWRTGDHKPNGLLMAAGPGIPPQRLERPVSVTDVAPTLAAGLGVALEGVDGKPIPDLS